MDTKELICVNCPKGCRIKVTFENNEITDITGYSCIRGKNYAAQETVRPMRVLTSTVKIENGTLRVLPVITSREIPLDMVDQAMAEIRKIDVQAPVKMDQVLIKNFLNTGADLVASRSIAKA